MHRLDVGTSGVVIFARRAECVAKWQRALAGAATRRGYIAAVRGVAPSKGVVARSLRDAGEIVSARTRYRRLAIVAGHSLLRVTPDEERTHQVRRHLASIGHPVLGDERYGHAPTNRYFEEKTGLDRTFLHRARLEVEHPDAGRSLVLEAPLPGELRSVLDRMGGGEALTFLDRKIALGALPPRAGE